MKKILIALFLATVFVLSGCASKNVSTDGATGADTTTVNTADAAQTEPAEESVSFSIVFDSTVDKSISSVAKNLPDKAIVYSYKNGETVLDALKAICTVNDIALVESSGYVTGIAGITAGDAGANSGWILKQNGELASVGASECTLHDGDIIEWFYTADFNTYFYN